MVKNTFKNKILMLFASACFIVPMCKVEASALSEYDEYTARSIQNEIIKSSKKNNNSYKIKTVQNKISKNEQEIKKYESMRSSLDFELAAMMQNEEYQNSKFYPDYYEIKRIRNEISKIKSKITQNECKIEQLKSKREQLDHEYAVLLQIQEKQNSYYYY